MTRLSPKYFHYFVSSLLLDTLIILFANTLWVRSTDIILVIAFWVFSNLINYPKITMRRYVSYLKIIKLLVKQIGVFLFILFLFYLFSNSWSEHVGFREIGIIILSIFFSKTLFTYLVKLYRISGFGYNKFIVIGDNPNIHHFITSFLSKKEAGNILAHKIVQWEGIAVIEKIISESDINEIYCTSHIISTKQLTDLMHLCSQFNVNLYLISNENESNNTIPLVTPSKQETQLKTLPLLDQKNQVLKRGLDIFLSLAVILFILSWLIPVLGILIKIESQGPVFFIQPRAGKNGKYFLCLKFRSMKLSESETQASKNDSRVTKIGNFIRQTSIDELPQFINVFLGHMSVVGPRPHIKSLNDKFTPQVEKYNSRLLVKPGITGLSQIRGHRGETIDNQTMLNRIRIDLLYIKRWSIGFDLNIILKTITKSIFVMDKKAY